MVSLDRYVTPDSEKPTCLQYDAPPMPASYWPYPHLHYGSEPAISQVKEHGVQSVLGRRTIVV
ncbi:hypothetical protein BD309DRAFT_459454 [Dichomitus squalens]|nr:hypothetical protein BD309DRAFT_459454 [Dichomitus squalens]